MGIFDFLKPKDINEGVRNFLSVENAVLLDVRTREEYSSGHIEGSQNLPLQNIDKVGAIVSDKSTPIFVHCQSGARSARAAEKLRQMGFTDVKDIGGIMSYKGKVVN